MAPQAASPIAARRSVLWNREEDELRAEAFREAQLRVVEARRRRSHRTPASTSEHRSRHRVRCTIRQVGRSPACLAARGRCTRLARCRNSPRSRRSPPSCASGWSDRVVARVEVGAINVLKTYDPPPTALGGTEGERGRAARQVAGPRRGRPAPGRPPLPGGLAALVRRAAGARRCVPGARTPSRCGSASRPRTATTPSARRGSTSPRPAPRSGSPSTSSATPRRSPGIATLGPGPAGRAFDLAAFGALLAGSRQQVKGLLRDQSVLAGVGNAYSDEVLHAARLSPFAIAGKLPDAEVERLHAALRTMLREAPSPRPAGKPAKELKDAKRAGMRVHGRTGLPCPVCGDAVREVSFADRSMQYCADLPDRRQAARRPPDVAPAEVSPRGHHRGDVLPREYPGVPPRDRCPAQPGGRCSRVFGPRVGGRSGDERRRERPGGVRGAAGGGVLVAMAGAGRAAREGRGEGRLLVAPRGAGFGDATRLVLEAARAERWPGAEVVHLHEHRSRRSGSTHEAA